MDARDAAGDSWPAGCASNILGNITSNSPSNSPSNSNDNKANLTAS